MTIPYAVIPVFIVSSFIHYPSGYFNAGLFLGLYPLGLFIGSVLIGSLSDKYGRKRLLLLSLTGANCCYFFTGLSIKYHDIVIFMLFRLMSGIFEGNIAIARAVIAELSETKLQIYKGFGWINAALTLSWIIGPLTGAYIFQMTQHNFASVFFVSGIADLMAIICIININIDFKTGLNYIFNKQNRTFFQTKILLFLFLFIFIAGLAVDGIYQFLPLYTVLYSKDSSFSLAKILSLIAFSNMIGNLIINEFFLKKIGLFFTLMLGFTCFVLSIALIDIHRDLSTSCILLFGISIALIITNGQALISLNAIKHSQGKLMGFVSSFRMLGCGIMSFSQANLAKLSYTLPFIISIALITLSCAMITYIKCVFTYVLDD